MVSHVPYIRETLVPTILRISYHVFPCIRKSFEDNSDALRLQVVEIAKCKCSDAHGAWHLKKDRHLAEDRSMSNKRELWVQLFQEASKLVDETLTATAAEGHEESVSIQ